VPFSNREIFYRVLEVKDSYETSLYLSTLSEDGPSGGLFHKEETLPW